MYTHLELLLTPVLFVSHILSSNTQEKELAEAERELHQLRDEENTLRQELRVCLLLKLPLLITHFVPAHIRRSKIRLSNI